MRDNLKATHWKVEDGYRSNMNESELYPHRVFASEIYDSMGIVSEISLVKTHEMCDSSFPCSGLLGLFMSISLLSIIEIIYYLTLCLSCKLRMDAVQSTPQ